MSTDLIELITRQVPLSFFTTLIEKKEEAYALAEKESLSYEEPERKRILGQIRHHRQNEAFRHAASKEGLSYEVHNNKRGENYSLVFVNDIIFGRTAIAVDDSIPSPAKFRKEIAIANSYLEPENMDLFTPPVVQSKSDVLCCLIITVNPSSTSKAQSVPQNICIGVPYTDLKGWHLFKPITEIIAAYRPAQELDVPDLAFATLKKKQRGAE